MKTENRTSRTRRIIGDILLALVLLIVLISSNYHMDRAVQAAKSAGFSNILRMPAPSSFISYGANVMYEVVLEFNELTLRQ